MSSVLVLMATHNGREWLDEQIASIAIQRRQDLHVALAACDDASTDGTVGVLEALVQQASIPFQWVRSELPGGGAGRNFLRLMITVDIGGHDFVALCDQDDIWYADKLERAVECLGRSGSAGYSAAVEAFWPDGRRRLLRQARRPTGGDHLFEGAGQGCSFVLSRAWFVRLQQDLRAHATLLLGSVHYHDWLLYAVARAHGEHWYFDDRPCLAYRQHDRNDTGARSFRRGLQHRLALIRSGWYGAQVRTIAKLCRRIDTGPESLPAQYLRLTDPRAPRGALARLAVFVLRFGRRRWVDRALLLGAAVAGLLGTKTA